MKNNTFFPFIVSIFLFIASLSGCFIIDLINLKNSHKLESEAISTCNNTPQPSDSREPVEVTIASVGDILMHTPLITSKESSGYNFDSMFQYVDKIITSYDYSVANLEVTTAGDDYNYVGYPTFNCPDTILTSLKDTGFDMVLGSNNHRLDTGKTGFYRTIEKVKEVGLDIIGVKSSDDDKSYKIIDIKGIKIGFTNYTYENGTVNGKPSINGIEVPDEILGLIDSYNQYDLESEKSSLSSRIKEIKKDGAEFIVFYPHWGEEYNETPIQVQRELSQFLCDEGVNVIIGGHPHVLEPTDYITSSDGKNKTLVLYSLGNFISDQRLETLNNQATEWGVIFTFTIEKNFETNTVSLKSSNYIPTWTRKTYLNGNLTYETIPTMMINDIENLSSYEMDRINQADTGITEVMNEYNNFSTKNRK